MVEHLDPDWTIHLYFWRPLIPIFVPLKYFDTFLEIGSAESVTEMLISFKETEEEALESPDGSF